MGTIPSKGNVAAWCSRLRIGRRMGETALKLQIGAYMEWRYFNDRIID